MANVARRATRIWSRKGKDSIRVPRQRRSISSSSATPMRAKPASMKSRSGARPAGRRPVQRGRVERLGLVELVRLLHAREEMQRDRRVHAEEADLAGDGRGDDPLRAGIAPHRHLAVGQPSPAGAAVLRAHREAAHARGVRAHAQRPVEEDARVDGRVRARELVELQALRSERDGLEHIGGARLHLLLRHDPVHALDAHRDSGARGPEVPLVLGDALQPAVVAAEEVGRVGVVGDHGDRRRRDEGRGGTGAEQQQGRQRRAGRRRPTSSPVHGHVGPVITRRVFAVVKYAL